MEYPNGPVGLMMQVSKGAVRAIALKFGGVSLCDFIGGCERGGADGIGVDFFAYGG